MRALGEIFYPDLGTPSARLVRFVVADGRRAVPANDAHVRTDLVDGRSLSYRQTFTDRAGRWRLTATYTTDPSRATVLADVRFAALDRRHHDVYAIYDPALSNSRNDDAGRTIGDALVASDASAASALVGSPAFGATSNGFRGTSDGWTDLRDGRLDHRYRTTAAGNLVQTRDCASRARAEPRSRSASDQKPGPRCAPPAARSRPAFPPSSRGTRTVGTAISMV